MKHLRDIVEDRKGDMSFTNQYDGHDRNRIQMAGDYLFRRGLRKGAKWHMMGTSYGTEDLGHGMKRRTIGLGLVNKASGEERAIQAKPSVERSEIYRKKMRGRTNAYKAKLNKWEEPQE